MSSNLPPGVTEGMIPGNRPEDMDEELFEQALTSKLDAAGISDVSLDEPMWAVVIIARDMGYEKGYADAVQDHLTPETELYDQDDEDVE